VNRYRNLLVGLNDDRNRLIVIRNEVIHEIWKIKETLAREDGYDVRRIVERSRERRNKGNRTVLSAPTKPRAK
jgi:hypothetical protein